MTETAYEIPSRSLMKAGVVAVLGAGAILMLFVLPAEYGIDPTGLGKALGLTQMAVKPEEPAQAAGAPATAGAGPTRESIAKSGTWRSDEMTITLPPHSGAEIKASMAAGDHMIFRWEASGPVRLDMHGEPPGGGEEFTSYWKERDLREGQGAFTAPFAGTHGWYWRNRGEAPVSVRVRTSGFYARLFQPPAE